MNEYIISAKDEYGYNMEQALGMLFAHKYDLEKATLDLPNYEPNHECPICTTWIYNTYKKHVYIVTLMYICLYIFIYFFIFLSSWQSINNYRFKLVSFSKNWLDTPAKVTNYIVEKVISILYKNITFEFSKNIKSLTKQKYALHYFINLNYH